MSIFWIVSFAVTYDTISHGNLKKKMQQEGFNFSKSLYGLCKKNSLKTNSLRHGGPRLQKVYSRTREIRLTHKLNGKQLEENKTGVPNFLKLTNFGNKHSKEEKKNPVCTNQKVPHIGSRIWTRLWRMTRILISVEWEIIPSRRSYVGKRSVIYAKDTEERIRNLQLWL